MLELRVSRGHRGLPRVTTKHPYEAQWGPQEDGDRHWREAATRPGTPGPSEARRGKAGAPHEPSEGSGPEDTPTWTLASRTRTPSCGFSPQPPSRQLDAGFRAEARSMAPECQKRGKRGRGWSGLTVTRRSVSGAGGWALGLPEAASAASPATRSAPAWAMGQAHRLRLARSAEGGLASPGRSGHADTTAWTPPSHPRRQRSRVCRHQLPHAIQTPSVNTTSFFDHHDTKCSICYF